MGGLNTSRPVYPYKTQGKMVRRPWFSPEEYKQLYEAARAYAKEPRATITNGMLSKSTTSFCSWRTQGYDLMKPSTFNIAT